DAQHRTKNLLARDRHALADAVEHRRLDVIARPAARTAAEPLGPLRLAGRDVALHVRLVLGGDERPHLRRRIPPRAVRELLLPGDHSLNDAIVDALLDEEAAARGADLSLIVENGADGGLRGGVEVRVGEDDVRALAPELERDALERPSCGLHHDPAGR